MIRYALPKAALLGAAVLFAGSMIAPPEADAARWRRARYTRATTNTYVNFKRSLRPSRRITYSGVSRAEQDFWRRSDAWHDHAFNGFRPRDFR